MADSEVIPDRIKHIVRGFAPDAKIILYGSRARGNAHSESDWDIVILLNLEEVPGDLQNKISYALYDLELEIGEVITPMIYTSKEWKSKYKVTPFYMNVVRDGIEI